MADKNLEREYTIPLRQKLAKTTRWKRAKKAVSTVRKFVSKHMKSEDIKIGRELNEEIWARGGKVVPAKVKIHAKKETVGEKDDKREIVKVNLVGVELTPEKSKKEGKKTKSEAEEKKKTAPEEKPKKQTEQPQDVASATTQKSDVASATTQPQDTKTEESGEQK